MEKIIYNKMFWVAVAIIALIVILFSFMSKKQGSYTATPTTTVPSATNSVTNPVTTTTAPRAALIVNKAVIPVNLSYADALKIYADRRIQLDTACQATPNVVTYKDNTGIMIDNRSAKTRTVKVGDTYIIKPYGFKIVVLPDIYLKAKKIYLNCDKSISVATILIQE